MQAAELRIIYRPRCDATTEAEISALAAAYRFILNCHAQREVAEPAPEPDGHDEAKEWKHGCSTAVAYLGAVERVLERLYG